MRIIIRNVINLSVCKDHESVIDVRWEEKRLSLVSPISKEFFRFFWEITEHSTRFAFCHLPCIDLRICFQCLSRICYFISGMSNVSWKHSKFLWSIWSVITCYESTFVDRGGSLECVDSLISRAHSLPYGLSCCPFLLNLQM